MIKDGLLLVDKQAGITSHDVVDLFRRRTRFKKVGHTGTLDPAATGLLVLCVGRTTRLQSFLMKMEKTYVGTIRFGFATNTYDAEGTPLGDARAVDVTTLDLDALALPFLGEIEQMPPQYSAKKIGGMRAYELARRGEVAALEPRRVTVYDFRVAPEGGDLARFEVRCSAGTYVRSLAHDLGIAAGTGAHLASLRRTAIGPFRVENAIPSASIPETEPQALFDGPAFLGMDRLELPLPAVVIDRTQQQKVARGNTIVTKPAGDHLFATGDLVSLIDLEQNLVAVAEVTEVLRERGPLSLQPKVVLSGD